jgi:hypothetical protein
MAAKVLAKRFSRRTPHIGRYSFASTKLNFRIQRS